MSFIKSKLAEGYVLAYEYYRNSGCLDSEAQFYANQFVMELRTNWRELGKVSVEDFFKDFVQDIDFAGEAEKDKERSRYV